jgi:hypothetical protein
MTLVEKTTILGARTTIELGYKETTRIQQGE